MCWQCVLISQNRLYLVGMGNKWNRNHVDVGWRSNRKGLPNFFVSFHCMLKFAFHASGSIIECVDVDIKIEIIKKQIENAIFNFRLLNGDVRWQGKAMQSGSMLVCTICSYCLTHILFITIYFTFSSCCCCFCFLLYFSFCFFLLCCVRFRSCYLHSTHHIIRAWACQLVVLFFVRIRWMQCLFAIENHKQTHVLNCAQSAKCSHLIDFYLKSTDQLVLQRTFFFQRGLLLKIMQCTIIRLFCFLIKFSKFKC